MSRDQGWEENFEYASGHLIISMYFYGGQTLDAGSWTWFGAEIWRPVPTSWESDPDCVTDPCQIDDVFSNEWVFFSCWCASDYRDQWVFHRIRWLYVVGWYQRCVNSTEWPRRSQTEHPLLQEGSFAQSSSRPHECRDSCLKTSRIYLFCMVVGVSLNL